MIVTPTENAPRLSWNRPPLDPELYADGVSSLFIFARGPQSANTDGSVYSQAQSVLNENYYRDDFTVEDLASKLGFSTRQIQRILKQAGSPGFRAEIRQRRIQDACAKLERTASPLRKIARECGYKQPSHFSQVFAREVGVSPQQYRQEFLGRPRHELGRAEELAAERSSA